MTADALLAEVFRRSDQLLAAWAVHALTAVLLVGPVLAAPSVRDSREARRLLAGLFSFLALANLEGMLWILKQWRAVAEGLGQTAAWVSSPAARPLAEVVDAPHPLWVVPFHLILDAVVIWALVRVGPRQMRERPAA